LATALHEQGDKPDAVNGKDEKDRDLYACTAFVFLLQSGALWNEWILVIHFQMALLRLFIEVLVECVRFAPGFSLKRPRRKIVMFRTSLHCRTVAILPIYVGGCPHKHPCLLISIIGKGLRRDVGGFETDPSSNKPVQALLRRLKSLSLPLPPLLLAMKPRRCKE
jgi:hypothetical protein